MCSASSGRLNRAVGCQGTIHIGTSGWHYKHWEGPFYPEGLSPEGWLAYCQDHLRTVEVNNAFYQPPARDTLEGWRETGAG